MNICKFSFFLVVFVLILDMTTKYLVQANIPIINYYHSIYPYQGIPVFENVGGIEFSIVHAINKGAAWGILAGMQNYLVIFRILLIIGILIYLFFYNKNSILIIPLSLVVAGAVGNVIDYFIYGHVIDMFHVVLWGYHYPIFNVADSAICIGIVSAFIISLFEEKKASGCKHE